MGLSFLEVYARLKEKFPQAVEEIVESPGDPFVVVKADALLDIGRHLKEAPELAFDYLACQCGTDDRTNFWSVYHLLSLAKGHRAVVKVRLPREDGVSVPSVVSIWPGADWHERETYDMYGIRFEGHPDLRRILLPEDWPGYPLRKDYDFPDHYQGIPLK